MSCKMSPFFTSYNLQQVLTKKPKVGLHKLIVADIKLWMEVIESSQEYLLIKIVDQISCF